MNILSTLTSIWDWVRNHALQQLLATIALLIICFLVLLYYPISIDVSHKSVRDYIETNEHVQYIVRSELTEHGAVIDFCTNTYYGEINHLEEAAK
jgi:hypothetical protein